MIKDEEKFELQELERSVDRLLLEISGTGRDPSDTELLEMVRIAERAAKMAFDSDRPDILSEQMECLIRWTDHLNEENMRQRFNKALQNYPLVSPW